MIDEPSILDDMTWNITSTTIAVARQRVSDSHYEPVKAITGSRFRKENTHQIKIEWTMGSEAKADGKWRKGWKKETGRNWSRYSLGWLAMKQQRKSRWFCSWTMHQPVEERPREIHRKRCGKSGGKRRRSCNDTWKRKEKGKDTRKKSDDRSFRMEKSEKF